ncbi:MAG: hypothetical protein B6244_01555 [Candidatus Cloacimonetes bacterium 4572_55]|nr:MAG: hypothetical protein B6244_01555 [Candidatus Cloacimonetes bacterium 4572_55]
MNSFRRDLRRSLLTANRYREPTFNYRIAFYLSTAAALLLVAIVAILIQQPSLAERLHYTLAPKGEEIIPMGDSIKTVRRESSADTPRKIDGATSREQIGQYSVDEASRKVDREFVRYLAQQEHQLGPISILPTETGGVYSVNQFRLNNGKRAVVFTQIPTENQMESY